MKLILSILLFISFISSAQTRYLAVYESKMHLDVSNLEMPGKELHFTMDSSKKSQQDSLSEIIDTSILRQAFEKIFEGTMTIYSRVVADSISATLEAYNGSSQINMRSDSLFYENGKWSDRDKKKHEDPAIWAEDFEYTGKKKQILGYTCEEAIAKDTSSKTIVWICKQLPQTISPGITTKNLNHAVFEYSNPKAHVNFIIKSFKKSKAT